MITFILTVGILQNKQNGHFSDLKFHIIDQNNLNESIS